jgi:hypothetical protein
MFPKAPIYELAPNNLGFMIDEAEHHEYHRRVGYCFALVLMPASEHVMCAQLALLLRKLDARRGAAVDLLHWILMFTLNTSGAAFHLLSCVLADRFPTLYHPLRCFPHY